ASLAPEAQEKIGIISPNRPEWLITDLAVQMTGAVLTPIYPTIAPTELSFVLRDAGVKKLFIAGPELYNRYAEVLNALPALEHVFTFDDVPGQRSWKALQSGRITPDEGVTGRI